MTDNDLLDEPWLVDDDGEPIGVLAINVDDLDWLEARNGCTRYAIGPAELEESIWLCDQCEQPHDHDLGRCPRCYE